MLCSIKNIAIALTVFTLSGITTTAIAEVVVISHRGLPVSTLDLQNVRDIWLGKTKHLADSAVVRPIDQSTSSRIRDEFYMKALEKTPLQVKAYWSRVAFTGKEDAPLTFNDDTAVKVWVTNHPGAIGYIDSASVDSSVKALLRLK